VREDILLKDKSRVSTPDKEAKKLCKEVTNDEVEEERLLWDKSNSRRFLNNVGPLLRSLKLLC
jgi:hypothetical protein